MGVVVMFLPTSALGQSTLAGEAFTCGAGIACDFGDTRPDITGSVCSPGSNSTIRYEMNGVASGPDAGTFHESGIVSVGSAHRVVPGGGFVGPLLELTPTFTVDGPAGQVSGRKRLTSPTSAPNVSNLAGMCDEVGVDVAHFVGTTLCYEATFKYGSTERGTSLLGLGVFGRR